MSDSTGELTNKPFTAQLSNVYFSILALFCFKLFVKISLNLLAYFYIVRGNRKEAARISAEFYDYGQQHSEYFWWKQKKPKRVVVLVFLQVVYFVHTLHHFKEIYSCITDKFDVKCHHNLLFAPRDK